IQTLHATLWLGDLLGNHFPMDGRPIVPHPRSSRLDGRRSVVWEPADEMELFSRWQDEEFDEVERLFARHWRHELRRFDFRHDRSLLDAFGVDPAQYRDMATLVRAVRNAIEATAGSQKTFRATVDALRVPIEFRREIALRWQNAGEPSLPAFAP